MERGRNHRRKYDAESCTCPDKYTTKMSILSFMGCFKGKSMVIIFERHTNLKYKFESWNFWASGYDVSIVGKNETAIKNYIRNQLEEDYAKDQISLKEYTDPFTGSK